MPKRLTVPDDHVALVLSNQLANELNSVLMLERRRLAPRIARCKAVEADHSTISGIYDICGDVLLAILEAKE